MKWITVNRLRTGLGQTLCVAALLSGATALGCAQHEERISVRDIFDALGDPEAWASEVGDHDRCNHTDPGLQSVCCKGLALDMAYHLSEARQAMDYGGGSLESLLVYLREIARYLDAKSKYCSTCGDVPHEFPATHVCD